MDVETPTTREAINRRLVEIQDELSSLDADNFKARYELQVERDRLRDSIRTASSPDAARSTEDLLAELEVRHKELAEAQESMVNSAGMAGGGGEFTGSYEGPGDGVRLNSEIVEATGAGKLAARIASLETILSERGAL
jgi:hypothetical protein